MLLGSEGDEFFFVRHAESLWNQKGLCQGTIDIDLSEKGKMQLQTFARKTAHLPIESIYSSPLLRALNTAKAIHRYHPQVEMETVDAFKERYFGDLQGQSSEKMYAFESHEKNEPLAGGKYQAETLQQMQSRLTVGMAEVLKAASTPLIVSHGRLFKALGELLGLPDVLQVPNLALIHCTRDREGWSCETIKIEDL